MKLVDELLEESSELMEIHEHKMHEYLKDAETYVNRRKQLEFKRLALVHEKAIWHLKIYQQDLKVELRDIEFSREL